MSLLILLFVLPLIFSLLLFCTSALPAIYLRRLAIAFSLVPLAMIIANGMTWLGMSVQYDWLPALSIEFFLQVDALSLIFLYLTAIVIPISLIIFYDERVPNIYYGLVLLLQGLLIGFFTARDLALFTLFWESMLIPLYFIITLWGGSERRSAGLKFLIYMIAGSTLMIAAVLSLYLGALKSGGAGTFNLNTLMQVAAQAPYATLILAVFILAFSVKTPLFPFHAWLPDAYYQAPVGGTILLSALLSKAGIYGFMRIGMGLFPALMTAWSPFLLGLAITGVLYGGLAAWRQQDYKRLIAYSSFSHVNFVLAGLFVSNATAHTGAILQAFNHGITITGLFIAAGWLEWRLGSTNMDLGGGLAKFMPRLCWLTLFFVLSSVALPGTNNFVGELLILFGVYGQSPWLALALGLTVILSVIYMLRFMQKVYFGLPRDHQPTFVDINFKQLAIALPLIIIILWIGIYPGPVLKLING